MTTENTTPDEVDELVDAVVGDGLSPAATKQIRAASVVPLHAVAAPKTTMTPSQNRKGGRKRGRPKAIKAKPTADELAYHAQMQVEQAAFIDDDEIVKTTVGRADSPEILQALKERMARLAATLEHMRIENQKYGKMDAQIVTRQVAALKEIAQIELKIRELGVTMIDLHSEPIQRVFALFIDRIKTVAQAVLSEEQAEVFFNRLGSELDGWEEDAENQLR